MENYRKIRALMSLLEDEDGEIASRALSELLSYGKSAEGIIKRSQESCNPIIRKRIHQLQAVMRIKKSREILSRRLHNRHSGLWNGAIDIHLLWFDRDSKEILNQLFDELFSEFKNIFDGSALSVANFMKNKGFVLPLDGDIDAEYLCIGAVIDSRIGSELLLSIIAYKLLLEVGVKVKIVKEQMSFGILFEGNEYVSAYDWSVTEHENIEALKEVETGSLLKHILLELFFISVVTNNFRYSFTIGSCFDANVMEIVG